MANERPETCYKTCFTMQHKGKLLDEFSMVHAVEGLNQGDTVKCVAGQCIQCFYPSPTSVIKSLVPS